MSIDPSLSPRRSFLGRLAGGAAALLAGSSGLAVAATPRRGSTLLAVEDEWLSKLRGTHRQFFDATEFNNGFPQYYAFNWWQTMKDTYKLQNSDITAVIGLRHFGIGPAFKDNIWQKYKLGEFFKVNDPKSKAPSVRNFMNSEAQGDIMFPGSSIDRQVANGAVVTVCNLATLVVSDFAAKAAGLNMKAADAYEEWKANMVAGTYLVPSGVLAVNRAQAVGKCTYCNAST
jgi:hypothetical protein